MSNAALDWAFAMPLRGAEKAVLLALANRAAPGTNECFPMQSTLALESGVSERSVRAALDRLEEAGVIQSERRQGRISRYVLNVQTGSKSEPGSGMNGKTEPEASSYIPEVSSALNGKPVPLKPEASSEEPKRTLKITQIEPVEGAHERATQRRGSRLPDDWVLSGLDYEFAERMRLDPIAMADRFRDYWHAKAGKDACKINWSATWRNWCRKEADYQKQRPTVPKQEFRNGFLEIIRRDQAGEPQIEVDNPVADFLRLPHVH